LTLVVDATVTVASVARADGFKLLGDEDLVAPALMWSEARSTLHLGLIKGRITSSSAGVGPMTPSMSRSPRSSTVGWSRWTADCGEGPIVSVS
jgi:hypothetical protein